MPLVFTELPTIRQQAFAAYGALFDLGVTRSDLVQSEQFEVVGDLRSLIDEGRTAVAPLDAARQREILAKDGRLGRAEECRNVLDSNIKRFTELSAKPYRGSEVVNAQGVVGWEDAVTKEIARFLVDEFTIVRDAIARYERSGGSGSDDVRA